MTEEGVTWAFQGCRKTTPGPPAAAPGRRPSLEASLIFRLSLLYVGTILVAAVVYLIGAWASHRIEASYQLESLADELCGDVVRDADGTLRLVLPSAFRQRVAGIPDFEMAVADDAGGAPAVGSSPALVPLVSGAPALWTSAQFFRRGNGRPVQGIVETVAAPAGMIRVAMVRGRPSLPDILGWVYDEVAFEVLPVVLPAMVLTLLIGAVTVRRAMAPLKRLSAAAGAIDPRQAGVRLAEDAVPREVLPLVQAMNRAIGRIELALQQQRRMTANAAHELRTPLAILRARLDGLPAGTGRDGLDRDVRRLSRLVEQLMTVSRLEAGQVAVDGTIDLVRVTREVLADAAPLAMAQGRAVELVAPGRAVMVPGNALALGDALMNLIDNALRHSPEVGTVEVAVEAAGAGDGRALPVVALEVRDRGPGIAAADRIQLFEPFWRGRDQHGKGSGLGLAIVAETVAVHGGTVSVQDRPGGGSVFRIELPAPEMVP